MNVLIVLALALVTAAANSSTIEKFKSRNIVIPAGRADGRITNGKSASDGEIPYQVGLFLEDFDRRFFWCGGSLISNTIILTAAHCLDGIKRGTIYLGSANTKTAEVIHQYTSNNATIHSGWNPKGSKHDIAVIKIPYTEFSSKIQPVSLPADQTSYSSFSGEVAMAAGWGRTIASSPNRPLSLQYGYLNVIPNNICKSHFRKVIKRSHVCVTTENHVSTCPGDSGGPLVLASTKVQIGVTSFVSRQGCETGAPAVFTRVSEYTDWIKQNSVV